MHQSSPIGFAHWHWLETVFGTNNSKILNFCEHGQQATDTEGTLRCDVHLCFSGIAVLLRQLRWLQLSLGDEHGIHSRCRLGRRFQAALASSILQDTGSTDPAPTNIVEYETRSKVHPEWRSLGPYQHRLQIDTFPADLDTGSFQTHRPWTRVQTMFWIWSISALSAHSAHKLDLLRPHSLTSNVHGLPLLCQMGGNSFNTNPLIISTCDAILVSWISALIYVGPVVVFCHYKFHAWHSTLHCDFVSCVLKRITSIFDDTFAWIRTSKLTCAPLNHVTGAKWGRTKQHLVSCHSTSKMYRTFEMRTSWLFKKNCFHTNGALQIGFQLEHFWISFQFLWSESTDVLLRCHLSLPVGSGNHHTELQWNFQSFNDDSVTHLEVKWRDNEGRHQSDTMVSC